MAEPTDGRWLAWTRRIAAIAQNGLTYTEGPFDRERYHELRRIAAEMVGAYTETEPERILGLFERQEGYATPKVDVRGVVFRGDRILLVREREDRLWTLPGGWADVGEAPREAVEKEIREESGYETRAVKLLAVYDRDRHDVPALPWPVYKLFIRCELLGGEPRLSIETVDVEFFAENEVPELSEGRATRGQIARMFEHLRHPDWPADLD
jgi:ADP-ribose pyrophosphatase YjhB (NUDIX family)